MYLQELEEARYASPEPVAAETVTADEVTDDAKVGTWLREAINLYLFSFSCIWEIKAAKQKVLCLTLCRPCRCSAC
jgi:hypothetical protein